MIVEESVSKINSHVSMSLSVPPQNIEALDDDVPEFCKTPQFQHKYSLIPLSYLFWYVPRLPRGCKPGCLKPRMRGGEI